MPLNAKTPTIDDRRYDDIVAEARTRIARYTPEWKPVWSDVNDSDPGITLVQLFAWMTEMMLYRMARVPEQNYIKFLELLGIELQAAQPARAEITFVVEPTFAQPTVLVPIRTQISAESEGGAPPIIFETARTLIAIKAPLDRVQRFDGYQHFDLSAANNEFGTGFHPFGRAADAGSALLLGFDATGPFSGPFPQVELNLTFWVAPETVDDDLPSNAPGSGVGTVFASCGLPESAVYPSTQIAWEYWNGKTWRTLPLVKDETLGLARSGHVYLKMPSPKDFQPDRLGVVAEVRYWIRARLVRAGYERTPFLSGVRTNTIGTIQAQTVSDEVLGGSDGSANQQFQLANSPVLDGTLVLEIDEGDGPVVWQEVDDFFASAPSAKVYRLNRTSGDVIFGDGLHGDIPVGNISNPGGNVVARTYRFGGGESGNVAANRLSSIVTPVAGIQESSISNLVAAVGGRDEERIEDAKLRAGQSLKNKCRAVTEADYEMLAKQAANIRRAKALPLTHPSFPDVDVPGVVTVIVVPDAPEEVPNPLPSEGMLRTVCAYLNERRLLTTEVFVTPPLYRRIEVHVEVIANNNADLGEVRDGVEQALLTYFHPLRGGEEGQGWPFGGNVFYSRVFQRIFSVPGVERIEQLTLYLDGEEMAGDITIPDGQLVYSRQHEILVNYSFEE